jgi:hypothetical protein
VRIRPDDELLDCPFDMFSLAQSLYNVHALRYTTTLFSKAQTPGVARSLPTLFQSDHTAHPPYKKVF